MSLHLNLTAPIQCAILSFMRDAEDTELFEHDEVVVWTTDGLIRGTVISSRQSQVVTVRCSDGSLRHFGSNTSLMKVVHRHDRRR